MEDKNCGRCIIYENYDGQIITHYENENGQLITQTQQDPHPEWLMGGNPNAIEAQEKNAQRELVNSCQLPRKINTYGTKTNALPEYEKMGIKIQPTQCSKDDLFVEVDLPTGWKKEYTEHAMWSHLVDAMGRIRAAIFYKGAFYDREAFINFETRYHFRCQDYIEGNKKKYADIYAEKNETPVYGTVTDGKTVIFKTSESYYPALYIEEKHSDWWQGWEELRQRKIKECLTFLRTNYPDYENIHAYWEK